MKKRMVVAFLVAIFCLFVLGLAFAYEVSEVTNGGTIEGRVRFSGSPPPPKIIGVGQDREVCGEVQKSYEIEGKKGGVKNVLVMILEIGKGKDFDFPEAVLGQKGCMFEPHIVLASPGKLMLASSDPIPHNIHTKSIMNPPINITLNRLKRKSSLSVTFPEIIDVKCDLHGWMKGYVVVAEHPYYAITTDDGSFQLREVPPGTYELEVWHAKLGSQTQEVTVKAGRKTVIEFTY
ncbi:MAG: carboxypeptidase regulatory-like domain-containing protein [Nitrospinaceae bacterium]|nr:carboxypeptidase regulatory-like domain-containing protein [Nitrospinaceae bacterium]HJO62909.1 carboxypeptidase regulatory-like domain-containing protein [Desulfobacterales bacterium]